MPALALSSALSRALSDLAQDLRRVFDPRFVSLVAYGHGSSVAFVTTVGASDIEACGPLVETWHRHGLSTPLLLTPDEFQQSLDAFPFEYQSILDHHVVIDGTPPFANFHVDAADLRRACETQAKGHLIHLRQSWLETAAHPKQLAPRLVASAAPLRAILMNVARLTGVFPTSTAELAVFAASTAGMPRDLVEQILALETSPATAASLVKRIGEYIAAVEKLWEAVDRWTA
jgi:hypothetical protein